MPIGDIVIVGLIVAAFAAFAGTLAWASLAEKPAAARPAKRSAQSSPFTARHA